MGPVELCNLTPLMERTGGSPDVKVALIDGPVAIDHPDLASATLRELPGKPKATCDRADSAACMHGTFVAGMLAARRGSPAPAICPECTLILRPIFAEGTNGNGHMPSATPEELAEAIIEVIDAGARIINLSAALIQGSAKGDAQVEESVDYAAHRGAILVAAAGNQGVVGSSVITRNRWVIPVAACNMLGRPLNESNLSGSIGRRGLSAPGDNITSLGTKGEPRAFSGTSAAAPFVTGAIALLWSEFPEASAAEVRLAVTRCGRQPHKALVPPLLDAWAAYRVMNSARSGGDWVDRD